MAIKTKRQNHRRRTFVWAPVSLRRRADDAAQAYSGDSPSLASEPHPPWLVPLLVLLSGTLLLCYTNADVALSSLFYGGTEAEWPNLDAQPFVTLYYVGLLPGLVMGTAGLLVWLLSPFSSWLRRYRQPGMFLALMLIIGPGLLVNCVFKPCWARPRPHQIEAFGGPLSYQTLTQTGASPQARSFPSGHASMGFYLMAPGFLLFRRRQRLARLFLWLGVAGGCVMGLTRVVQGRHFASDVLWSAGLVYFTGFALYLLLQPGKTRPAVPAAEDSSDENADIVRLDNAACESRPHGQRRAA